MAIVIGILQDIAFIIMVYYCITFIIIRVISWFSLLFPMGKEAEEGHRSELVRRYERMNDIVDFLCDIVYPWSRAEAQEEQ
ncbi:MAG: hypothetical protein HFF26_08670 [Oscillospiraceae bacterium]|nr:hypothetical protein [Oscillospiraceae bacterium]